MSQARLLAVELDGQPLLVDANLVQEVVGECSIVEVPHVSGNLHGIFLWKGKAVPLVELTNVPQRTLDAPRHSGQRRRTLVFRAWGEWAGMRVDDATDVLSIEARQLQPVRHNPFPFARYEVDDGSTIRSVIDLPSLLAEVLELSQ